MIKNTTASLLLLATPLFTHTVYSHNGSAEKCINIIDNEKRLSCYDQYFNTSSKKREVSNKTKLPKKLENNVNSNNQKVKKIANNDLFGLEKEVATQTPEEMSSEAVGEFKSWDKDMQVNLKNGQVWQINSSRSLYYPITNPKITIEKGAFGSFYMSIEGINRSLKVKRVK